MDAIRRISFVDFKIAARFLAHKWSTVINPEQPPWTWIPHTDAFASAPNQIDDDEIRGYLALDKMYPFQLHEEESVHFVEDEGSIDPASLVQRHDSDSHCYDLHILYSDSYMVPVLYFRAYANDGSPLCMDDIKKDLPPTYAKQLSDSKWTFITQEEHPYLNRPWYKLHPCGTSEWMKLLYDSDSSLVNRSLIGMELYLVLWLSVVGPMVGLKIPMGVRKQLIDEAFLLQSS